MQDSFCLVAVNSPFNNSLLTYKEGEFSETISRGQLVEVPLGKRKEKGCILKTSLKESDLDQEIDLNKIKPIGNLLEDEIIISESELELFQWMSSYYHYNVGQLIFDCLPKSMKRPRALNYEQGKGHPFSFDLNSTQSEIVNKIESRIDQGFSKWLVHGVTGSGKTIIYLNLIKKIISKGSSALFLLPEINLTPQFIQTFVEHLDAPIYSYNSSISNSDKYGLWKLLQDDDSPKVVIGVRSSVYLPIKNLGIIIVDEEHDQSFKQDDRCPYNARDVAIKKSLNLQIPIVLGSATPSMETYQQFVQGENYCKMNKRVGVANLPDIELVDMRAANKDPKEKDLWPFNTYSLNEIQNALEKKEQVLVFVNRLGFANYIQCGACGHQFNCPNCTAMLRYFKKRNEVSCSYCDYKDVMPEICPDCGNMALHQKGFGTEKLQSLLQEKFPGKKVSRFDRDEVKTTNQLEERLGEFHRGDVDILVGTQMLSKGHNFKNVNLVLILGIDSQLNFPDFRACERVYQLLTQVSGRSGRFGEKSKVLIHTLGTENRVFSYVVKHSFDEFYKDELEFREMTQNPPYSKLAVVYLTSKFQDKVIDAATQSANFFKGLSEKHFQDLSVLGPRPGFVEKRQNKFTWSLLLRCNDLNQLHNAISTFEKNSNFHYSVGVKVDVDPYHLI